MRWFDADFSRARAPAILGDPDAVRFVPLTTEQRFEALRDGRTAQARALYAELARVNSAGRRGGPRSTAIARLPGVAR